LASLHNGTIQLWDYQMEVKIHEYDEHQGPVRGVNFHNTQPLFVSGGDDYKIKVWNYEQHRCLFNLLGHLDYIRTVQFHHNYPWIVSASDDMTVRLWNWQSRTCLSVLTGHNHYVMSAHFHLKEDWILSASLDQTARVWDFSGLRKRSVNSNGEFGMQQQGVGQGDLFGSMDVVTKFTLEGHSRGVNWAAFHRALSLVVTAADDREIKLWRYNDTRAWEVDTLRGHLNNVSCVMFHPKKELILSNSEDKSLRVWDISKQAPPMILRKDNERYWILEAHPNINLMAAGHDTGLIVFKLQRDRPPIDITKQHVVFFRGQMLYQAAFTQGANGASVAHETPIAALRRPGSNNWQTNQPRSLSYNYYHRQQHAVLLTFDHDSSYELYVFPKVEQGQAPPTVEGDATLRGHARGAVFVSSSKFAVLDRHRVVQIKSLKNEQKATLTVPAQHILTHIFPAGRDKLLMRTPDAMLLFDVDGNKLLGEMMTPCRYPIRYIHWSENMKYVAMLSKANIFVATANLEEHHQISETERVKSGVWDPKGVLIYSTSAHLKYLLPNGDYGIIRTMDSVVYLTAVSADSTTVHFLDREGKAGSLVVDNSEYMYKACLLQGRKKEVLRLLQRKKLVSQSDVAYLQKKGYPELAMQFVKDDEVKFSLALECGNIRVALECASKLDRQDCWHRLGVEALRQGNHQVVEAAYQKTKNFERLSLLYLMTGDLDKLNKMLAIATRRGDVHSRFHNALYLGNVQERVNILAEAGQTKLAYVCAMLHGLDEQAAAAREMLGEDVPEITEEMQKQAKCLLPPNPIIRDVNWPLLDMGRGFFDELENEQPEQEEKSAEPSFLEDHDEEDTDAVDAWGADLPPIASSSSASASASAKPAGGWGDDLDLPVFETAETQESKGEESGSGDYFAMPLSGQSPPQQWQAASNLAADLCAAGAFDMCMHLLNRQIGAINFAPLKPHFLALQSSAFSFLPQLPGCEPLSMAINRAGSDNLPELSLKLSQCTDLLREGYKAVQEGAFKKALGCFQSILSILPLLVVDNQSQASEVNELISISKEYITAVRLALARTSPPFSSSASSQALLTVLFTYCKIEPMHLVLGLKLAIKQNYTVKNFKSTAMLCRRVLELCATSHNPALNQLANPKQITDLLKVCEKSNTDEAPYGLDESLPFAICCATFTPLYKGKPSSKCPYCGANYKAEMEGALCQTCDIAKIGAQASGIRVLAGSSA